VGKGTGFFPPRNEDPGDLEKKRRVCDGSGKAGREMPF